MNEDLKQHLEAMESRMVARIQSSEDRTAALVAAEVGALHTQIQEGFDRVDRRLDLQGTMLAANTKALGGLLENTANCGGAWKSSKVDRERQLNQMQYARTEVRKTLTTWKI